MSDYLYHWGVKGMKWGVRRYQNKDGTLTPKGKKRYTEYDPTATVKKSKRTKTLEKLAASGQKHAKIQDDLYKQTGDEYHKRSAEQWRRESAQNQKNAEASYKRDVFNKTANRQQKKEQKAYDKAVSDPRNRVKAYNDTVDYANNVLIPKINKKYSKIIKTDDWADDPNYGKYIREYEETFTKMMSKKYEEIVGRNPYNV